MKDSHLTLRLPADLARLLARWARSRGLPKSEVAREAVALYLAPPVAAPARRLSAADLAERWRHLPRLSADEARDLGHDIDAGRRRLPEVHGAWE